MGRCGRIGATWLGLVVLSACAQPYDSAALGIRWEPPSGIQLQSEQPGPPAVAAFNNGIEFRSAQAMLPAPGDEKELNALLLQAFQAAGLPAPTMPPASARSGTCPLGPVARYDLRTPPNRVLVYVVPLGGKFLLMRLTTGPNDDGKLEAAFERSLSSLKLR